MEEFPKNIEEKLKLVSIRGRMAIAITCLENVINKTQLRSSAVNELIDLLWRFVEMADLGEWDESITKKADCILRWSENKSNLKSDSEFYKLPDFILTMFVETIEIGTSNLYGGVENFSHWTLNPTINVLKLTLENGFSIPSIEHFEKSSFLEFHGWGNCVSREFFMCNL